MATRQPIAKIGQQVMIEGYDKTLRVVETALPAIAFPFMVNKANKRVRKSALQGFAYKCKPMQGGAAKWFAEDEIEYVLTYNPVSIDIFLHAQLVHDLATYETLRDYLETLPEKVVQGCNVVRELKKLVEQAGKLAEGDHQERVDAESEIISIVQ